MKAPVHILGLPVHPVSRDQALEEIERFVAEGSSHLVITADASALMFARRDPEFRAIFEQASLVTADGAGVVRAVGLAGARMRERCSGVELVEDIARRAAQTGWRVYLLGAAPGVAEAAGAELARRYPGLVLSGCGDGFFEDGEAAAAAIREAGTDILLIAMGMPRQEKWFWSHREQLGVKVAMGVGGTFDVLSGRVRRAPVFFQKHGLEWLYRFMCAPRKSSRKIILLPIFAGLALAEARRRRGLDRGQQARE